MRNTLHQEVDHALQSLRKLEAVPSKLELWNRYRPSIQLFIPQDPRVKQICKNLTSNSIPEPSTISPIVSPVSILQIPSPGIATSPSKQQNIMCQPVSNLCSSFSSHRCVRDISRCSSVYTLVSFELSTWISTYVYGSWTCTAGPLDFSTWIFTYMSPAHEYVLQDAVSLHLDIRQYLRLMHWVLQIYLCQWSQLIHMYHRFPWVLHKDVRQWIQLTYMYPQ